MNPIRKCRMRQLLDQVTTTDETDRLQPASIKTIKSVLQDLKKLDEEANDENCIKHVDETFMDVNIYHIAADVAYKCSQSVNYTQHTFNPDDFIDKLQSFLTNEQPDEFSYEHLNTLGDHVLLDKFMPSLTSFASIYGGLTNKPEPPPKERKQKEVVEKAAKKQLIKVVDLEKEGDKRSDDILRFHMKVLSDECKREGNLPVDYYNFVIDTGNFGLTVENIFYTSFNLNDGKIKLILEDNIPRLCPLDKNSRLNLTQTDSLKKNQVITSITMDDWKEHCERMQEGILQRYRRSGTFATTNTR